MNRPSRWLAPLLVSAIGCTSSSIASDMRTVRDLSHVPRLARVTDVEVDPAPPRELQRMLEQPLDADGAVRIAMLNNRELRASLRELGIARGQLIQAGLLPNPRVEAELLPERETKVELRAEYDITKLVLAPMRARAAAPALDAARYRTAAAVIDTGYRVRLAFYALQAATQRLALSQQLLDAAAAGRDAAHALRDAGNLPALDAANEEIAFERMRVQTAQLELALVSARERVIRLLGLHGAATAFRVQAALAPIPDQLGAASELETRALRASLGLREMRARLLGLARQAGFTRTEGWLPDIAVDVHGLQGDSGLDGADNGIDEQWHLGAGVSVEVPLFDRKQGTAVALEAQFDALLERYYASAVDLRSAAREARSRLESAHARARAYAQVIVPSQQRITAQTVLQYNAMQIGVFQLLQARREELSAQLESVDTLREYWSAAAALDALLAGGHALAPSSDTQTMTSDSAAAGGE